MKIDPVTLEVIRNALPAISNEMSYDLQRTSYNMMIYEVRDYCCALLDVNGNLLSQNVGGVSHFVADLAVVGGGSGDDAPALLVGTLLGLDLAVTARAGTQQKSLKKVLQSGHLVPQDTTLAWLTQAGLDEQGINLFYGNPIT